MFEMLSFLKTLEEFFSKDYMDVNKIWVTSFQMWIERLMNGEIQMK
jgi:hypothetical protein